MLALGIGVSTAVFSLVNTILLKPMPYPKAGQIVVLWRTGPLDASFTGPDKWPWAPTELKSLQQTSSVFQNLGAFKKESFNLTGSSDPVLLEGVRVRPDCSRPWVHRRCWDASLAQKMIRRGTSMSRC